MLAFLDESGDAGLRGRAGSSPNFVVVLVWFETEPEASFCADQIRGLRAARGWHPRAEFKFNKADRRLRMDFLERVTAARFRFAGAVIDKAAVVRSPHLAEENLYLVATRLVVESAVPHLRRATVVLDRSGGREFRRTVRTYLQGRISGDAARRAISVVRDEPSHSNDLLQLADMIAGAVARSFRSDRPDAPIYRARLSSHETVVQTWPG